MDKPIIRHCMNCKYHIFNENVYCYVRYKYVKLQRLAACLCKFYKQKDCENK